MIVCSQCGFVILQVNDLHGQDRLDTDLGHNYYDLTWMQCEYSCDVFLLSF